MFDFGEASRYLPLAGMVFTLVAVFACLFFLVRSQKLTDKIVAINMIAVMTLLLIVMVGNVIGEEYLVDVALVYGLLSFLATMVFTRFLLQFKLEKPKEAEADGAFAGADDMLNMGGMPDMSGMGDMGAMPDMDGMLNMEGMINMDGMINMEGMTEMADMGDVTEMGEMTEMTDMGGMNFNMDDIPDNGEIPGMEEPAGDKGKKK